MYLFGGSNGMSSNLELYSLDLNTLRWEVLKQKAFEDDSDNIPETADEHTAVVAGE
jgi:hypothetical protein